MTTAALLFALLPVQDLDWVYVSTDPMGMDADGANFLDRDPFGFDSVDVDLFDLDPFSEDPLGVVPWGQDPTPFYSSVDPIHSSDPLGNMGVPNYGWGLGNTTGGLAASFGEIGMGFDGNSFAMSGGGYGLQFGVDPSMPSFHSGMGAGGHDRFSGALRGAPEGGTDSGLTQYGLGGPSLLEFSRLMLSPESSVQSVDRRPMLKKEEAQNVMDTMLSPLTRRQAQGGASVQPTATSVPAPTTTPAAGTAAARVHEWFQTLDTDQNGEIDDAEFRAGTLLSSHVFGRVDGNQDGHLDVTELKSFLLKD